MANSNSIASNYSFSIKDFEGEYHDFFLQAFPPDKSSDYLHGKLFKKGQLKGEIFVSIDQDLNAVSISENPFGGIWIHGNLTPSAITFLIQELINVLRKKGIKSLIIIQPPDLYCHQSDLIIYLLFTAKFKLLKILTHQFLSGKKKLKQMANAHMKNCEKKASCLDLKINTDKLHNFSFLQDISNWNQMRGYKSSFTEDRLIRQVSIFPERYFLISILHENIAIAHTLAVKLTNNSLYYFLSGINPKNQQSTTGELMMAYLLKLAVDLKVSFLDYGSSDNDGVPNHNLMFFKSKYTNVYSNKYIWKIEL